MTGPTGTVTLGRLFGNHDLKGNGCADYLFSQRPFGDCRTTRWAIGWGSEGQLVTMRLITCGARNASLLVSFAFVPEVKVG
jgi:hypothetical protein